MRFQSRRRSGAGAAQSGKGADGLDRGDNRELYNGFGDTLARAFEFVATPALFGFLGHLGDGWLGTRPILTIVLVVYALVGSLVRMYYWYEAGMSAHEAKAPWNRREAASS